MRKRKLRRCDKLFDKALTLNRDNQHLWLCGTYGAVCADMTKIEMDVMEERLNELIKEEQKES